MKKNYFLCALLFTSVSVFSQKTIIVNGGLFGNNSENANVVIHDRTLNTYTTLDTIHTQSVQDILIDGNIAYVAAQDSIIKYDLQNQTRVGAAAFNGASTKTFKLYQNELLVGNWYGRNSDNIYIYNTSTMNLVDSISSLDKGAKSILIKNNFAYVTQNGQTSGFEDTLATIVKIDIPNRVITDTITISGYTGDFGELVEKPNGLGFHAFNSVSNTISSFDYANLNNGSNQTSTLDIRMSSTSHWSLHQDTLFGRIGRNISAINLNNLQYLDSNMADTAITSFTYDTLNRLFFVTYTNFSTVTTGYVYSADGVFLSNFTVGFSPEVIDMYYDNAVGVNEISSNAIDFKYYPNPVINQLIIEQKEANTRFRLFDGSGRLIMENRLVEGVNTVDVSNISRGNYYIQLIQGKFIRTEVLIKQ